VDRGLVEILDLARLALLHLLTIRPLEALLRTTITEEVAPAVECTDRALTATEQQTTTIIPPPIELATTMKEREIASTWIKETIRTEDMMQQTLHLATTNHVRVDIIAKSTKPHRRKAAAALEDTPEAAAADQAAIVGT
jgi:hypothetical protein